MQCSAVVFCSVQCNVPVLYSAMYQCYTVQCSTILCSAMYLPVLCSAMYQCSAVTFCDMQCNVPQCHVALFPVLCHAVLCCAMYHSAVQCNVPVLCSTVHCAVPCCAMLSFHKLGWSCSNLVIGIVGLCSRVKLAANMQNVGNMFINKSM